MGTSGRGHEQVLAARGVRKELGAYYTPPDVVSGLLDLTLAPLLEERSGDGPDAVAALRVLDPACGTGNFLVAAAERIAGVLEGLGIDPSDARRRAVGCIRGIELDAPTARLCRAGLRAVHADGGGRTIVRGDALLDDALVPVGGFDLVVGNPPFLSQLAAATARSRADAASLRSRFGPAVGPYTDPASVFLLAALRAARPDGGVVCLIEPVGLLSARDARAVRASALDGAALRGLWVAQQRVFDADVDVCAPVLVRGASDAETALVAGRSFVSRGSTSAPGESASSWSSLLAAVQDLPDRVLATDGVLGDLAHATADFRDQYYGLAGAVMEQEAGGPGEPCLVTSGLIDPGQVWWGARSCRFNKAAYRHPRVDLSRLSAPMQSWAERRLVPKVLVATQTRVLEAVVDPTGAWLPSVPIVTVTVGDGDGDLDALWRIGALLCSPAATLVAARRHLGAARSASALRLSARDLLALPLPADGAAWDRAASWFAEASTAPPGTHRSLLRRSAQAMGEAYGLGADDELLAWWEGRLPQTGAVTSGP